MGGGSIGESETEPPIYFPEHPENDREGMNLQRMRSCCGQPAALVSLAF